MKRALTLLVLIATWSTGRAEAPSLLAQVRAAAFERAREPLADEALEAARLEVRRAAAAGLPRLRLHEQTRLGLDGAYGLTLEAGIAVPLLAPDVPADGRVAALRLTLTRRQLAAQRRAEARDALARAVALEAAEQRLWALIELDRSLRALTPSRPRSGAYPSGARNPPAPPNGSAGTAIDARLLAAGREAQLREARRLRSELSTALGVALPPIGEPARIRGLAENAPTAAPLGFGSADLEATPCIAASDAVVLAGLAARERASSARLRAARSAARIDLELGGALRLGDATDAEGAARIALSVRLPPWSPVAGAASLTGGAAGLEQEATLVVPNRTPAPPPPDASSDATDDPVDDARSTVRSTLLRLQGEEADLLRRRRILAAALSARRTTAPRASTALEDAYLRATLRLRLADVDQALGLNGLDAALLCGALPP